MSSPTKSAHTSPAPARVWVLLASEANTAVIFRRGPSRWTRLYLWDTQTDVITPGSWFAGRLYEWLSDLSPNGQHLLYFARNESKRRVQAAAEKFGDGPMWSWTALCQPPYVRALGLWNASDGYSGGGIFRDNRTLSLNHSGQPLREQIKPENFNVLVLNGQRPVDVCLAALQRTGWRVTERPKRWIGMGELHPIVLRKGLLELRFICPPTYKTYVSYAWHGADPVDVLDGASWADFDQQQRLVVAKVGRLYRVEGNEAKELIDLNSDQPKRQPVPS